jgi:hypothetical protein
MTDIPQPAPGTYDVGDVVEIHIARDDPDARFDGTVCEVVDVFDDDLDVHTGRSMDATSYRLRDVDADEVLPVSFRHRDLVPVEQNK